MKPDPTPIEDPRNAIGLLTDVLDLVFAQPAYQLFETGAISNDIDMSHPRATRDLGRMFTRGARKVMNGYRRRGTSELYQQLKLVREDMPVDDYTIRDQQRRVLCAAVWDMSRCICVVAMDAMEDSRRWEKHTQEIVEPATSNRPATTYPPPWVKTWQDHIHAAGKFGVDVGAIAKLECNWRFRDLTARTHRGLNTRAAFEAAWLAGQYDFAKRMITEPFQ